MRQAQGVGDQAELIINFQDMSWLAVPEQVIPKIAVVVVGIQFVTKFQICLVQVGEILFNNRAGDVMCLYDLLKQIQIFFVHKNPFLFIYCHMNDIQIKYNDIVLKYSITKIHLISK